MDNGRRTATGFSLKWKDSRGQAVVAELELRNKAREFMHDLKKNSGYIKEDLKHVRNLTRSIQN